MNNWASDKWNEQAPLISLPETEDMSQISRQFQAILCAFKVIKVCLCLTIKLGHWSFSALGLELIQVALLVLRPLVSDWKYTNSFPGYLAFRQHLMGLLSLHNHVNQLLHTYISGFQTLKKTEHLTIIQMPQLSKCQVCFSLSYSNQAQYHWLSMLIRRSDAHVCAHAWTWRRYYLINAVFFRRKKRRRRRKTHRSPGPYKKDIRRVWKSMKTLGSTDPADPWLSSLATLLGFLIYLPPLSFPARTAMFTYPRHWKQMKNRILGLPPSLSLRTAISFLQSPYTPYTHTFRTYWLSGGLWIGKKIARFPRAKQVSMQASSL